MIPWRIRTVGIPMKRMRGYRCLSNQSWPNAKDVPKALKCCQKCIGTCTTLKSISGSQCKKGDRVSE
jgi:hypothetical protein